MSLGHEVEGKTIEGPVVYIAYNLPLLRKKEAFAICLTVQKFHPYIPDTKTILRSDHLHLKSLLKGKINNKG